ncbi:MAG: hypothetical protein D3909_06795 [Candidatus Electrothrix sp. ATG1]|nr:hypothetical protein [Candidatus Electrothrix sp. ATG1]
MDVYMKKFLCSKENSFLLYQVPPFKSRAIVPILRNFFLLWYKKNAYFFSQNDSFVGRFLFYPTAFFEA